MVAAGFGVGLWVIRLSVRLGVDLSVPEADAGAEFGKRRVKLYER